MYKSDFHELANHSFIPNTTRPYLYTTFIETCLPIKVDGWSLYHGLWGFIIGSLLLYRIPKISQKQYRIYLLVIHTLWELIQFFILQDKALSGNKVSDSVLDTVFFMACAEAVFYYHHKK